MYKNGFGIKWPTMVDMPWKQWIHRSSYIKLEVLEIYIYEE